MLSLKSNLFLLCLFLGIVSWGQIKPLTYTAHKATSTISVDGKANEKDWEKATWSSNFIDIEGTKTPQYATRFKMLWDDTYMYYFVEMEEPHVWGNLRKRDTVVYYNNDFEIFWDPDGDTHHYYEFEINALNTIWDLFLTKPYREKNAAMDSWNIDGIKSAIIIDGTLNDATDTDNGWQIELAIPWAAFRTSFGQNNIPVNKFWRINFSRVNWDFELQDGNYHRKKDAQGKYLPEYNWVWSPQGVINMHQPETWGYVYFTDQSSPSWEIPKEEEIRWHLYKLYREMESCKNITNISQLKDFTLEYKGHTLVPILERHKAGWNIYISSEGQTYLIREDGKYNTSKN